MSKPTTIILSALAALTFSTGAWAEKYTVSEEDLDEFVDSLALEGLSAEMLESQFDGVEMGTLDFCVHCRPIAYAVAFQHGSNWTVINGNDISWNSYTERYEVCWAGDTMTDVDGVRQYYKTTSSSCCNYCDSGSFGDGDYFDYDVPSYETVDDGDCWFSLWTSDIFYEAEETSYYTGFDFNNTNQIYIGRMDVWTESYLDITNCPD